MPHAVKLIQLNPLKKLSVKGAFQGLKRTYLNWSLPNLEAKPKKK